jgi:hypothetical protein
LNVTWQEIDRATHWDDLVRASLVAYETRYGRATWILFKQNADSWTMMDGHGTLAGSAPASLGRDGAFARILQVLE